MAEHKVQGGTMLLFIDPAGGTNYDTVVCLTSVGKTDSIDPVDASSACGPDKSPGKVAISYSFEGQHLQDPDTGKISGTSLRQLLRAKTFFGFKISPVTPVTGDEIEEGVGYFSELSSTYAFDSVGVFSGVIQPVGQPTITVDIIPPVPANAIRLFIADIGSGINGGINTGSSDFFDLTIESNAPGFVTYVGTGGAYYSLGINLSPGIGNYYFDLIYSTLNLNNYELNPTFGAFPTPFPFYDFDITNLSLINTLTIINVTGCSLSSQKINELLAFAVTKPPGIAGIFTSVGQTPPAPPTGQGIIDAGLLVLSGYTVTTD